MHRIFSTLTAITKITELCLVSKVTTGRERRSRRGGRVRKCTLKYLFLHSMFIHKYSVPCFLFSFIMCRIVWEYTERCFIKSHLVIYWYCMPTTQFWFWNIVDTRYKHTYERTFRKMVWNMKWGFFLLNYDFFQGKLCKSWVCILNKKVQIKFCLFFSRKKKDIICSLKVQQNRNVLFSGFKTENHFFISLILQKLFLHFSNLR